MTNQGDGEKHGGLIKNFAIISLDEARRQTDDGIIIWPWQEFLKNLWLEKIF